MNRLLRLDFLPRNYHLALLLNRVVFGLMLAAVHGWSKIIHFSEMKQHFPDPIHIGVTPSLLLTIFAEVVCGLLIVVGLAARWAALFVAIDLGIAFTLVHKFALAGPGNGELALLYSVWALGLFFAGPGKFSFDRG